MKHLFYYGLVGLLCLSLSSCDFLSERNAKTPVDAITPGTPLIVYIQDPDRYQVVLQNTKYYGKLEEAGILKGFTAEIYLIDSLFAFAGEPGIKELWGGLHLTGADSLEFIWILNIQKSLAERFINENAGLFDGLEERIFRDVRIYEGKSTLDGQLMSFSFYKGLFVASKAPFLVEDAIVHLQEGKSLASDRQFTELMVKTHSAEEGHIYVNLPYADLLLGHWFDPDKSRFVSRVPIFADWLRLDIRAAQEGIHLYGYLSFSDSLLPLISRYHLPPPANSDLINALPQNTASALIYGVNRFDDYLDNTFQEEDTAYRHFAPYFRNWPGQEWAFFTLPTYSPDIQDATLLIVEIDRKDLAEQNLEELNKLVNQSNQTVDYRGYPIKRLNCGQLLNQVFGAGILPIINPYYSILDDKIVFANSLLQLQTYIDRMIDRRLLGAAPEFAAFNQQLASSSNLILYLNLNELQGQIKIRAREKVADKLSKSGIAGQFSPVEICFTTQRNKFFINGFIAASGKASLDDILAWKLPLDDRVAIQPHLVVNHYTQENEIFVQDIRNQIYLIDRQGKILWKRQLDERINSPVYQMDYYLNGKLQMAFSTPSAIYVIDRTGKDVADFPLKLPARATNGVLLVNYDNKNIYRFFIACENKHIYGYEKSGKPLPGWNPKRRVGIIPYPVMHFQVAGKDYLCAMNDEGEIYCWDRQGKSRFRTVKTKKAFFNPLSLVIEGNSFRLFNADTTGMVYQIDQNGDLTTVQVDSTITQPAFRAVQFDLTPEVEWIFIYEQQLKVYDEKRTLKFRYQFPEPVAKDILVFSPPSADIKWLGFYGPQSDRIFLINAEGRMHYDFPLKGNSPFLMCDLYGNGSKVTVTGDKDANLLVYQLR